MGRPEETVWWDQVTRLPDGRLSCKYCPKKFTGGVPRIKLHLSCRGGNIGPCKGVPSEIQEKAEKELGEDTSVGKVKRDKALQASPMKRRRVTSVGEHGDGVNVAETGETSYMPANVMPSPSSNIDVAALFQFLSSVFNNCESTTNRATQEYAADVPSFTRVEELLANLNLMNRARNTSVGKVKRDKALKASPMKRRRHTSVEEHSDGVDVAERGETNNMPLANRSLDMAAVELPESHRADAVSSMVYEANARLKECQKQVTELQAQLAEAQAELLNMQFQKANLVALIAEEMGQSPSPTSRLSPSSSPESTVAGGFSFTSRVSIWEPEPLWT